MRFIVKRTSRWSEDKPCEGAVPAKVPRYDVRTFKTPEEHDAQFGHTRSGRWHDRGTEHEVLPGVGISRRLEDEDVWMLDLHGLDDLVAFVEEHGEVVVSPSEKDRPPTIEIYDDYRE